MTNEDKYPHRQIGNRLRAFREIRFPDLEQQQFAELLGVTPTRYANWEKGSRRITLDTAFILEKNYGLSLDFIYLGRLVTLSQKLTIELSGSPLLKDTIKDNETA